jgi:hypothetical protein
MSDMVENGHDLVQYAKFQVVLRLGGEACGNGTWTVEIRFELYARKNGRGQLNLSALIHER